MCDWDVPHKCWVFWFFGCVLGFPAARALVVPHEISRGERCRAASLVHLYPRFSTRSVHIGVCPWRLWSFLSWDLSRRALNGKLNQYSMDVSYFCLKISAFMMLRLIYLIPIAIGQMNTKYKMLDLLRPWEMASLTFRGLDEPWRQVGLLGREILMWKCICRTHSWKTTAERTSHKHAAHWGCP